MQPINVFACQINLLKELREDQMKTDAELARPNMTAEERIARIIARAEGHNDDGGMQWERYIGASRLILRECWVVFPK